MTVAPGTTAFEASVTKPETAPVVVVTVCAAADTVSTHTNTATSHRPAGTRRSGPIG